MAVKPKKVVLLAFNAGMSGFLVNGPGISLRNFLKFASSCDLGVQFSVFTQFPFSETSIEASFFNIKQKDVLTREIDSCDVVHCWSGLENRFKNALIIANKKKKPVILGPNLLDSVNKEREKDFLLDISFDMLLTANCDLKRKLQKLYCVDEGAVKDFMVGPDPDLWAHDGLKKEYILWKGNGKQKVKGLEFAKSVANKLPEYKFYFIGDVSAYNYLKHIPKAKSAKLFINTSLSETKGMAQLEQMLAGTPSITHPKIYCHGINNKTGIVTDRSVDSYVSAINKIMKNEELWSYMSLESKKYVETRFSPVDIVSKYREILSYVV